MPSFNLVDQPWIPCLMLKDGSHPKLGLKEVLARAHEIREIYHPSPLVIVALHRLLLAILHRNFGPASLDEWQELWSRERWDMLKLGTYLNQWRHRFDLFDDEHPFYQVPYMEDAEEHPVATLAQELASGNNPTQFDHTFDHVFAPMIPAEAPRYLLAEQAFSIGLGKSKPFYFSDAPLTRGFTVLVRGNNLFETLALNLVAYNNQRPMPWIGEDDPPKWEHDQSATPDRGGTPPGGYLDYLTWQSRTIHLIIEEGDPPRVVRCQERQNLKLADPKPMDPFKCHVTDKKTGVGPLSLRPERSLWRDSNTLFQQSRQSSAGQTERPEVFNWVARVELLRRRGRVKAQPAYSFSVFGFATDPGKAASVTFWRHERLPLPLAYLEDMELVNKLDEALKLAEAVAGVLRGSVGTLAERILFAAREPNKKRSRQENEAINRFVDSLAPERAYWPNLETPFTELLVKLPEDRQQTSSAMEYGLVELPKWAEVLRRTARNAFTEATRGLDGSARTLHALAQAERQFNGGLRCKLKGYLKTAAQEEVSDESTG